MHAVCVFNKELKSHSRKIAAVNEITINLLFSAQGWAFSDSVVIFVSSLLNALFNQV